MRSVHSYYCMYIVNVASDLCVCVLIISPAFYSGLSGARALELGLENYWIVCVHLASDVCLVFLMYSKLFPGQFLEIYINMEFYVSLKH